MTYAEAACRFGDKVHRVRFFDSTSNLCVTDRAGTTVRAVGGSRNVGGDSFYVDLADGSFKRDAAPAFYGHPVLVDGVLYDVTVSPDGSQVAAKSYSGTAGFVRLNHAAWQAWFIGQKHALVLHGGQESVPVPPDTYRIYDYQEWSSADSAKPRARIDVDTPSTEGFATCQVAEGKTEDVRLGSPIVATIEVSQASGTVRFRLVETDVAGRRLTGLWSPGEEPFVRGMMPAAIVSDASGKTVARINLAARQYGIGAEWTVPPTAAGALSVRADYGSFPIPVDARKTDFRVGGSP